MKKFTIYANCQGQALAKMLMENTEFFSVYEYLPIKPVQLLSNDNITNVLEIVRGVDLFIYQPIQSGPRDKQLSSTHLKGILKNSAIGISFPSLYFDGYFPHLQSLLGYTSKLNLVHDYFIAYLCASGFNERDTLDLLQSDSLYPKGLSNDLCEKSIEELRSRENMHSIDIKMSDFIAENFRNEKLFNQFNHPKRKVFCHLSSLILARLDIKKISLNIDGPCYLGGLEVPLYRSSYKNLELVFEEKFETYTVGKSGQAISQDEIVSHFFKFYKSKNLEEIRDHIILTKPYIPKIIEDITGCTYRRASITSTVKMRFFTTINSVKQMIKSSVQQNKN